MPRNMNRFGAATFVTLSMVWPVMLWGGSAAAEPSSGVSCFDLVQQMAAQPPGIPESLDAAVNTLSDVVLPEHSEGSPLPVGEVLHGTTAQAAPGPVSPPVIADAPLVPVAPLVQVPLAPPAPAAPAEPVVAEAIEVSEPSPAAAAAPDPRAAVVTHAAATPVRAPGPGVPVVPVGAPAPVVPVVTIPAVPLGDAVPGLPLLPATLPVPQDLICEGTAWAAEYTPTQDGAPMVIGQQDRRDEW